LTWANLEEIFHIHSLLKKEKTKNEKFHVRFSNLTPTCLDQRKIDQDFEQKFWDFDNYIIERVQYFHVKNT
jgi:hypothetical protein